MRKYEKRFHMRKNSVEIGTVVALYLALIVMIGFIGWDKQKRGKTETQFGEKDVRG